MTLQVKSMLKTNFIAIVKDWFGNLYWNPTVTLRCPRLVLNSCLKEFLECFKKKFLQKPS